MLRAIGDGQTILYIQDILVHPNYQRQGIGRELLSRALREHTHIRQVVLMTDHEPGTPAFYHAVGMAEFASFGRLGFMRLGSAHQEQQGS